MTTAPFVKTNPEGKAYMPSRRTVLITEHLMLTPDIVKLTIRDEYIAHHGKPAQFVNLYSKNAQMLSPRPFGIAEINGDEVSFIFAIVGSGTQEFSTLHAGDTIDVLGPLGKPFDLSAAGRYLLVAGGLGIPPILHAAQALASREDTQGIALFGYRDEQFANTFIEHYCEDVRTIDNEHGNVVTLLNQWVQEQPNSADFRDVMLVTCGPLPMMKAVASWAEKYNIRSQMSLEERMGCGYGTCVVCVTPTIHGYQKVCIDGPVFTREELGWK